MSGLSLLPNLLNKQVCLLGKPAKMTKLCKNDIFEGFFKGNFEANLGTYDPF